MINDLAFVANLGDSRAVLSRRKEAALDTQETSEKCVLALHQYRCQCKPLPENQIVSLSTVSFIIAPFIINIDTQCQYIYNVRIKNR